MPSGPVPECPKCGSIDTVRDWANDGDEHYDYMGTRCKACGLQWDEECHFGDK